MRKIRPGLLIYQFELLSNNKPHFPSNIWDMLLYALQVMHIMVTFEMFK